MPRADTTMSLNKSWMKVDLWMAHWDGTTETRIEDQGRNKSNDTAVIPMNQKRKKGIVYLIVNHRHVIVAFARAYWFSIFGRMSGNSQELIYKFLREKSYSSRSVWAHPDNFFNWREILQTMYAEMQKGD